MNGSISPQKLSFWPIMLAIGIGNFLSALSSTTVTIMLPVFMKEFSADIVTVQWVITGYMLSSGMVAPLIGYLADKFSLKRTYLFAIVGFLCTSLFVGVAKSAFTLICFRILQGCFGGMIFPLTMSIVFQTVEKEKQAFALSIWSVSGILAPTLGPTVAGIVTDLLNWQWVFFMNIPVALLAALIVVRYIPYFKIAEERKTSFDYLGLISAIIGTYCLLFVFSNLSRWGILSVKTMGLFAIGMAMTAFFIYHELHCAAPLLNLKVLHYHNFLWSVVILCVAQITMNASILVMPIYLQNLLGYSTTMAAIILALGPLGAFFFIPMLGKLYDRVNVKYMLYLLMLLGGCSMLIHRQLDLTSTAILAASAVLVRDLGVGSLSMPTNNMGMQGIPLEMTSHASATSSWIRQCVVSLAIGLINTFMTMRTSSYLNKNVAIADATLQYNTSYIQAMHDLFLIILVVILFGLFAISRMRYHRD